MPISRRSLLQTVLAAGGFTPPALSGKPLDGVRIGVTDWDLQMSGRLEAVKLAAGLGFEGIQISLGRKPVDGRLAMDNPELTAKYVAAAKENRVAICSTCLDVLHDVLLKSDKQAEKYVLDAIRITRNLKSKAILVPMFKGAPVTPAEYEYVGDRFKELGPIAQKAGIQLALEGTLSAEQYARIMDRSRSKAVTMYYDVGITVRQERDPAKEIRWLGKNRIAEIHLKDVGKVFLGAGKVDIPACLRAIADIGYRGFAVLETGAPSGSVEADMKRNLAYVRSQVQKVRGS